MPSLSIASDRPALPRHSWLGLRTGVCEVCRAWTHGALCGECLGRFAAAVPRCPRCAIEVPHQGQTCGACLHTPPPQRAAVAALTYGYPWDALIQRFKRGQVGLADPLAALMARAVECRWPAPALPPPLVVPVPLSHERLRDRGFNQAWELARRVARRTGWPAYPHLLLRVVDTPHQLALPRARRLTNLRGAFMLAPGAQPVLAGRPVVLVDDVMTTGATVAEVARTLLQGGAAQVDVCVAARTPQA